MPPAFLFQPVGLHLKQQQQHHLRQQQPQQQHHLRQQQPQQQHHLVSSVAGITKPTSQVKLHKIS